MAELSSKRANFYKQIYFPSTYYKEVFDLTLEEAQDTKKAQAELQKLLIDADTNLARLSDTFRIRQPSFGQELQTREDKELLAKEGKGAEAGAAALRKLEATAKAEALNAVNLGLQKAKEEFGPVGRNTATYNNTVAAAAKSAMSPYGKRPAIQRAIFNAIAAEYGQSEGLLNAGRTVLNDASLDYNKIREAANSPEDKAALAALKNAKAGEEPTTPAGEAAQARLDAMASPFANGSTEQTDRVAAGLESDEEDALLRLYLSRLQDKNSPGEVTEAEIAAEPRLAEAELVYQKVSAQNSYQKSASEWYAAEYLSALKTKSNLEKKAATDPFDDLGPYRWAQREALKRGGYTKESLLHLQALTTRPELAPYVNPAFTRLRAEGGLEPRTASEAAIQEAFVQSKGKLTIAELDSLLTDKRSEQIASGREAAQGARKGGRDRALMLGEQGGVEPLDTVRAQRAAKAGGRQQARDLKATAREVGNMYTDPAAAEDAKAYLLALRLNKAGTPATPDTGTKIEVAVTEADVTPTAKDAAGANVNRAAAAAKSAAEVPVEVVSGLGAGERAKASKELEGSTLAGSSGTVLEPAPDEEAMDRTFTDRTNMGRDIKVDPTDPRYSYQLTPSGDSYIVFKDGVATTPARKGSRAFSSITSVLGGGPALAQRSARGTVTTGESQDSGTVTSAVTSSVDRALGRKPVIDLGVSDRPAPSTATATPATSPTTSEPAPKSEAEQLKALLTNGALKSGTAQFKAALDRLDELEGL